MAKLNEKTEKTEKIIHLVTTTLCNRDCKYCCNKQYDINAIEFVTEEELRNANKIFLTGGEPFLYTQPDQIAEYYKTRYKNIEEVYVYTNAFELLNYLIKHIDRNIFEYINGLTISIKTKKDAEAFKMIKNMFLIKKLKSNIVYVFDNLYPIEDIEGFKVLQREWKEDFEPADDSIFRRM